MFEVGSMKKIRSLMLSFVCILLVLCSLTACSGEKYPMRESSREEKETVLTVGGQDVPYELFRAFFLTRVSALDSALSWEEKWTEAMPAVLEDISRVYAVFSLCETYGINPYSKEIDKILQKRIKVSIEGGEIGGIYMSGYESYDQYIEALEKSYLTDRAARILLRYQICEEKLLEKLTLPYKSEYQYTEDDLKAFYESDAVRLVVLLCKSTVEFPGVDDIGEYIAELVAQGREALLDAESEQERINLSMQYFRISTPENEIKNGVLISPHAFSKENGAELLPAAFELNVGEYSEIIRVSSATDDYYYIVYLMEKDTSDYKSRAEEIEDLYLRDCFYRELEAEEKKLLDEVVYTDALTEKENTEIVFE